MQKVIDLFYKFLGVIMVLLLAAMVAMVFGNVTLRYGFNSGLLVSEELSRYCFVWLTFVGAVLTFHEHSHMGIESLVQRFGRRGRMLCMAVSNIIIMGCSGVFFWGALTQFDINATMFAPVTGLSLAWVYGIGLFTGAACFLIAAVRLIQVLTGTVSDEEIARFAGEDGTVAEVV
ncbi:TRAP transporter small permease [Bordetella sp. 15P40C-2]|uniref:TRAP transporter small permease n=1 Tax=Bordetella sp. 15P40C-2 TaxID=2572246 RepID=UPI0013213D7A|nr:TRAP transporter small permease [Bordetella sp. 15P40C-2]MVW70097.1 TRAP transporter small permease subunit [Bordetella sp. 15P40C-2]